MKENDPVIIFAKRFNCLAMNRKIDYEQMTTFTGYVSLMLAIIDCAGRLDKNIGWKAEQKFGIKALNSLCPKSNLVIINKSFRVRKINRNYLAGLITMLSCITVLNFNIKLYAQQPVWAKEFTNCTGYSCKGLQLPNSDFIIGGSFSKGTLMRLDTLGNILWAKEYNDPWSTGPQMESFVPAHNGGFIMAGSCFPNTDSNFFIYKTDSMGVPQWGKISSAEGALDKIIKSGADKYLIAGVIVPNLYSIGYYAKINLNGNILWSRSYNISGYTYIIRDILIDQSNDIVMTGEIRLTNSTIYDVFIHKADSNGYSKWFKTYEGVGQNVVNGFVETADHGYMVCGSNNALGTGLSDVFVLKTDSAGDIQWAKNYSGSWIEWGTFIKKTNDNNYFIGGGNYNTSFVLKIDENGDTLWTRNLPNSNGPVYSIEETMDNGLLIVSDTQILKMYKTDSLININCSSYAPLMISNYTPLEVNKVLTPISPSLSLNILNPLYFIKGTLETDLCPSSAIEEASLVPPFDLFPNPFSEFINVDINSLESCKIVISDLSSRVLLESDIQSSAKIDTRHLQSGVYLVQIRENDKWKGSRKMIKQ